MRYRRPMSFMNNIVNKTIPIGCLSLSTSNCKIIFGETPPEGISFTKTTTERVGSKMKGASQMIESIAFDERTHKYTAIIDGQKRYPASVSEVCRGSYGYISPAAEAAMKRGREVHDDIATRLLSGEEPKKIINKFARFTENLYTVHVEHPDVRAFWQAISRGNSGLDSRNKIGRLGCHRLENRNAS